jgi:hypothetical protein
MAPFEALYGRKCFTPSCWVEVGVKWEVGPDLIRQTQETVEHIRRHLQTVQSRQKSYADLSRRAVQFQAGDRVFLKVSPLRGVQRFGVRGKLAPRFVGPFEIERRVGEVAYQLALPTHLQSVHNVFHVSNLRKYVPDSSHVVSHDTLALEPDLTYSETPVWILERSLKRLRNKEVPLVKVLWGDPERGEMTWETEASMREKYPTLFTD